MTGVLKKKFSSEKHEKQFPLISVEQAQLPETCSCAGAGQGGGDVIFRFHLQVGF